MAGVLHQHLVTFSTLSFKDTGQPKRTDSSFLDLDGLAYLLEQWEWDLDFGRKSIRREHTSQMFDGLGLGLSAKRAPPALGNENLKIHLYLNIYS